MNNEAAIIPRTGRDGQVAEWQHALAAAVDDLDELLRLLQLRREPWMAPAQEFPLRVPRSFVARMRPGDPRDPLLLQVLPVTAEDRAVAGFTRDPLQEGDAQPVPGLLAKYPGRVLLTLTGACGIHCRYCFRRHFPYGGANPLASHWPRTLAFLRRRTDIREVILSGGDPLSLTDERLARLAADLDRLPHLRRLRIHSRLPVVLPERLTPALAQWLDQERLTTVLVLHVNHPRELDAALVRRLRRLGRSTRLLNQSVLLRGVNDSAAILAELSERLDEAGVLPYYLHLLDPVAGAAHFQVPTARARALVATLRTRLPGYLVPRLAREAPGQPAKIWLN